MKKIAILLIAIVLSIRTIASPIIVHFNGDGIANCTSNILANASYIDSQPFDGITINISPTWDLLAPGQVYTYDQIYGPWLQPLKGVLKNVTHNYCQVVARPQADPFDDYTQAIANWVAMAESCRDAGLEGIWFDNEVYYEPMWNYPGDCKYGSTKSLAQYQAQYQLVGQQVMHAILNVWPSAKVLHTHSPDESDPDTPAAINYGAFGGGSSSNLAGYFFLGMFSTAPGQVIDGGEAYLYRQQSDFSNSYNWRKNQMEYDNSGFVPPSLQTTWQTKSSVSFSNYDSTYQGVTMDPSIWQSCITWGLQRCDYIVWTYSETQNYLAPGGAGADWITAIWNARQAVGLPAPGGSPTHTPTPTPTPTQAPAKLEILR
jgi:hypothetical protein